MRNRWWAPAGLAALALIGTACGSSGTNSSSPPGTSSGAPASGSSALATTKIGSATVLTNAKGFTIYTFAVDTSGHSNCNGSCARYWPPVKGPVTAMAGVKGTFATIMRSDGTTQETWNGHPLYTYVGDTAPGQAKGNGLNLSGGVWHEVTVAGAAAPASNSSSSSGGGFGY
jgi:predicted lipoprotein with Yx(FWY)xxD motif